MVQHKAMTAGHCIENRMCSILLLESVVHYFQQYFLSWLYILSVAYSILWPGLPKGFFGLFFYFNWKVLYLGILWGQGQRWGTCFLCSVPRMCAFPSGVTWWMYRLESFLGPQSRHVAGRCQDETYSLLWFY